MAKDMLGTLIRKIADLPLEILGTLCDLVEKMSGETGHEWLVELKKFLRKEKCWAGAIVETILKLISGGRKLVIDAADGTEILAKANDVFAAGIDSDFVAYGADESGLATPETSAEVYEMAKDATFAQIFGSLSGDLNKLCFTQAQIKAFVKSYRNWLRADGYATFFLFKSCNQFFVAYVRVSSYGRLLVYVYRFGYSFVWYAGYRLRVVVPQLA